MPPLTGTDTIRILVATDSHVGYGERDPIRKDDSWKSFDEVMRIAKNRDVDMVLLAGDLFHDNKPSRQALYQVIRSLRMNCLGEKPCELEMLSDKTECFESAFDHINYEDPDINISIPVFSIHGNHDDPTDILQVGGLINYYGRTHESDNIQVKPILLQKGRTKLALYGMSNVRDERLFRTFRDGKVKFFRPSTQSADWFNLMSVHQNRHAYSETGYLPENFLPEFMDLIVWGHEHESLINPRQNPETGFHIIQPGSSVATSLVPGEAVPKHVAIVSVTGKDFQTEPIQLKSVRPFVMKEISLSEDKEAKKLAKKENNRTDLTRRLVEIVDELIEQAKSGNPKTQGEVDNDDEVEAPLPLIRLRVEYSAPAGGSFDLENPQRFSNRFVGRVANVNDVVQFHRRKAAAVRKARDGTEMPEESVMAQLSIDSIKVEKLVREFLTAQSLTILPQNSFGDAVAQFVDKDDKHAMEMFVSESLKTQVQHLLKLDADDDDLQEELEANKSRLEQLFRAGHLKKTKRGKLKPKPENWDTDLDGNWSDQPGAIVRSDVDEAENLDTELDDRAPTAATRVKKKPPSKPRPTRGGKRQDDVIMLDDDDNDDDEEEDDDSQLFVQDTPPATRSTRGRPTPKTRAAKASCKATQQQKLTQTTLKSAVGKTSSGRSGTGTGVANARSLASQVAPEVIEDDDEEDDDDDAFAPAPAATRARRR